MENKKDNEFIYFEKSGKIEKVRRPDFGEIVLRFKHGQPYDVEVTEKIKI